MELPDKTMNYHSQRITLTEWNFHQEVIESEIPVMVEFGAEWCGTCHIMAPLLENLAEVYQGRFKICKVDIDSEKQIADKFGINTTGSAARNIPTFLFFNDGEVVDHLIKGVPQSVLIEKINFYIALTK